METFSICFEQARYTIASQRKLNVTQKFDVDEHKRQPYILKYHVFRRIILLSEYDSFEFLTIRRQIWPF